MDPLRAPSRHAYGSAVQERHAETPLDEQNQAHAALRYLIGRIGELCLGKTPSPPTPPPPSATPPRSAAGRRNDNGGCCGGGQVHGNRFGPADGAAVARLPRADPWLGHA